MNPDVVVGIDPGTRVIGWGALAIHANGPTLHSCGVLKARASDPVAERLGALQAQLDVILAGFAPKVKGGGTLAIETAFTARNMKSALRIGEARGMVLASAARRGFDVVEIAPATAKKAVVGHGAGSKQQVSLMVASILGVPPLEVPQDATDALAVALAHLHKRRLANLVDGRRS